MECLCQMIRIVGKSLDAKVESKVLEDHRFENDLFVSKFFMQFMMDDYIARLKELTADPKMSSRIRFLCMDVVELRTNKVS